MTNPWRGDVALVIDGEARKMRLTLGALAALEAEMQADCLVSLVQRFETGAYRTGDVISLLSAGLAGGGSTMTRDDLMRAEIKGGPMAAAQAAAQLLSRAFAPADP